MLKSLKKKKERKGVHFCFKSEVGYRTTVRGKMAIHLIIHEDTLEHSFDQITR